MANAGDRSNSISMLDADTLATIAELAITVDSGAGPGSARPFPSVTWPLKVWLTGEVD